MTILDGLNPNQRAAVEHDTGPLLVVAGAGTGKTQVITRRIAYLIEEGRAEPGQVLALTFTEKAAREMQERIYELIGWRSFQVPVMTFHAFGAELLGRFASHIGRSIRGGLINNIQKTLLLQQHFSDISMKYYGPQADEFEFLEGVVAYIEQLQNAQVAVVDYDAYVERLRQEPGDLHPKEIEEQADLAVLYQLYERIKAKTGTYDYNDQLALPLQILRERPNLAQRLAHEFRYVLVDEYQDTNAVQDALLRTFVGRDGNMFAVGDDDQAIYGFRGADVNNILAFAEHYRVSKPVVLVRNYRSGQTVLDAAYRLIQHNNPDRLEAKLGLNKHLQGSDNNSQVSFLPYATAADELDGVAQEIDRKMKLGMASSDMAVLAATHAPLKALARILTRRSVPHAISNSVSIFEQPELLSLWYLLKWLDWQASDEAVAHVMLGSFVGWSMDDLAPVLELSRKDEVGLEDVLRRLQSDQVSVLLGRLEQWRSWARELPVSQLTFRLVFETGVAQRWQRQAEQSPRMLRVFEDLQRFLSLMQDFETVSEISDLNSYLAAFPKPPALEVSEAAGDAQGVQLLTVHAAKGLEFGTVFVINCTQRSWSRGRSLTRSVPEDLLNNAALLPADHELRRLMYVAVTRAKTELRLSAGLATAGGVKQLVSPFVSELLGSELELDKLPSATRGNKAGSGALEKLQRFYPMQGEGSGRRKPSFEDEDGWLDLSVTALGLYNFCPFEFYLQHVLKISQPLGPQLEFGSSLHHVFELYYKAAAAGEEPSLEELSGVLEQSWSGRGYVDRKQAEADLALAQATLKHFFARENRLRRPLIASELPVRFEVPEARLRLRGKIDAVFEREDGYEIRDFKTGRTQTSVEKVAKQAKESFQLRSYALACEQLRGEASSAVVLDYVVTEVEGEAVLSPTILRNHRDKLASMADRIRARDFAPNSNALHTCAALRYYGTGEADELMELQQQPAQEVPDAAA